MVQICTTDSEFWVYENHPFGGITGVRHEAEGAQMSTQSTPKSLPENAQTTLSKAMSGSNSARYTLAALALLQLSAVGGGQLAIAARSEVQTSEALVAIATSETPWTASRKVVGR
jgi:hypothetical protein